MGREIKFRAWDRENNTMYSNVSSSDAYLGFIMQFTGLKDKNGVEIYEGDIVIVSGIIGQIIYDVNSASFLFDKHNGAWNKDWTQRLLKVEVIGNIYQNPELLEE